MWWRRGGRGQPRRLFIPRKIPALNIDLGIGDFARQYLVVVTGMDQQHILNLLRHHERALRERGIAHIALFGSRARETAARTAIRTPGSRSIRRLASQSTTTPKPDALTSSPKLPDDLNNRRKEIPWQRMAAAGKVYRHDCEDVAAPRISTSSENM